MGMEVEKNKESGNQETNYFMLFGLPLRFFLDSAELEKNYLELQRKFHPDNFVTADVLHKSIASKQSSLINIAYKELLDPTLRAAHMLRILLGKDSEKISGENTVDDPEFLMEQMQWREDVEEAKDDMEKLQGLLAKIKEEQDKGYEEFSVTFSAAQSEDKLGQSVQLLSLLNKMRYLNKLEQDIRANL